MARQVVTILTDDLDGGEADRTVEFGIDGVTYTIDLSDAHAGELRTLLDPYISAGSRLHRRVAEGGRRAAREAGGVRDRGQTKAIRDWAAKNGYELSGRGRIPAAILEAYNAR